MVLCCECGDEGRENPRDAALLNSTRSEGGFLFGSMFVICALRICCKNAELDVGPTYYQLLHGSEMRPGATFLPNDPGHASLAKVIEPIPSTLSSYARTSEPRDPCRVPARAKASLRVSNDQGLAPCSTSFADDDGGETKLAWVPCGTKTSSIRSISFNLASRRAKYGRSDVAPRVFALSR